MKKTLFLLMAFFIAPFWERPVFAKSSAKEKQIPLPQFRATLKVQPAWRLIGKSKSHALLKGKKHHDVESVALFLRTKLKPGSLNPHLMRLQAGDYLEEKVRQLSAEEGLLLATENFVTNYGENPNNTKGPRKIPLFYGIGLQYQANLQTFSEKSFFVDCSSHILVVKILTEQRAPASEAVDMVRGIRCD